MATKLVSTEPPKPWELIGALLGYFAIAKDVPQTVRLLYAGVPQWIRAQLAWVPGVSDGFILFWFTITLAFATSGLLWRTRVQVPSENTSTEVDLVEGAAMMRRWRFVRVLRTLGIAALRDWLLDRLGVGFYLSFERPNGWGKAPDRTPHVDRILFRDGSGVEYQYSARHDVVFVREHAPRETPDPPPYQDEQVRPPNARDRKLLLVASTWHFGLWYLCHVFVKPRDPASTADA